MHKAARLEDISLCAARDQRAPLAAPCDASVLIEGVPAARLASKADCPDHGADLVGSGAAMVLIGGLPAARIGDGILEKGVIVGPGANQVLIGGPTFAVPSVITIEGDEAYRSKVVRDLYFISTTRSGREILERLNRAGQPITIKPITVDQPNTRQIPNSAEDSLAGRPTGSVIYYDPEYEAITRGANGEAFKISPQEALFHESIHASTDAAGTTPTGHDPKYPVQGGYMRKPESQAIGVWSYEGTFPTENTFRDDLGLKPHRAVHVKQVVDDPSQLPPQNFRPGSP
jgi:uncharacterized Zn-binding protein involved in type VI secretion